MHAQSTWDIRKSRPAQVLIAFLAILALVVSMAPAATTEEMKADSFRYLVKQVTTEAGVDTDITKESPLPLAVGDGGPLNGGGGLNLRYRVEFTCDRPLPGSTTCEGAQIVMKIPDVSYRWDSDKDGGDGRLLQQPTFEVGTATVKYFDTKIDELNRTVTLTVRPGWNVMSATGYINFPTSVNASIPGEEELPVTVTYGEEAHESTTFAYTTGQAKPEVSKTAITNDNTWIKPGEIFEYTLRANRDKSAGTQAVDGVLLDTLPKGLKFLGFREVASATSYRLRQTGETFRVDYSYDEATRQIKVEIPEDFAAHYIRTNGLGVNVVVQVEDETTLKDLGFKHGESISNKVDFEWEAIDDKSDGTISSSVSRKLDMPEEGGSGGIRNYKKQHGSNSAVTENEAVKSFELYFSNPTNGADLKVTDIPTPWPEDDKVLTSPGAMELRTFPKQYYQDANGVWGTRDPQGSTMTFFFDDGTNETVAPRATGGWLVYDNPRRDEFPAVRVTRTELTFPKAPAGNYQFVARTDGILNSRTPDTYRAQNCMQYEINGKRIPASQNAKRGDADTSCVDIPVAPLKADPKVEIGDGPQRETFTLNNGENLLGRLSGDLADGLTPVSVSFGIFNNNPLAGTAKPTAYLTTPQGLMLNPESLKWRDPNPNVNGKCSITPDDLVIEELDENSPNDGRKYRVTLDPEKFPDGLPVNTDPAANGLTNCGITIQVLRDENAANVLTGGQYNSEELDQKFAGIGITVVEEQQDKYIQSQKKDLTDTYGVVPESDYPEGVTGAPKIHQAVYPFTIPSVNARTVSKSVKGDRDEEFKEQINWNSWNKEFATGESDEPGYWDDADNRDRSLAIAERTVEYRISGGSSGTIPLDSANIYDFLPSNDNLSAGSLTGSTYEESLSMEDGKYPENGMIPTLAGPVTPVTIGASDVDIRYSRSTNPCRPDFPGVSDAGCDPQWLSAADIGDDWASVKVIRISFINGVDRVHDFTYSMKMPPKPIRENDGLRRSDIAYNHVALTSVQAGQEKAMEPIGPFAAAVRYVPAVRVDKQIEQYPNTSDRELLDTATEADIPTYVEGDEINYILNANNQSEEYVAEGVRVIDRLPDYLEFVRAEEIKKDGTLIDELPAEKFIETGTEVPGATEYAWVVGDMAAGTDQYLRVVSRVKRIESDEDFVMVPNYANIMTEDQWRDYDGVIDTKCEVNVGFQDDCDIVNAEIDLRKGTISGTYFRDVQADGAGAGIIDDADQPMSGQKVVLHYDWSEGKPYPFVDENDKPLRNADGTIKTTMETTTDAEGNYAFTGLVHGTYWVEFETRAGLPFVEPTVGDNPLIDSDAAQEIDGNEFKKRTANIELGVGDNLPGYNAGVYGLKATIQGTFWFDKDENGVVQAAEGEVVANEALTGGSATVELWKDGERVDSVTTTDGSYSFPGLDAGDYEVRVTDLPDGWRITDNPVGKDGNLVEAEVTDNTVGQSGTIELDWAMTADRDVPIVNTASLSGTVYREYDRDGRVADNAPTVAGAIVYLLDSTGERIMRDGQPVTVVTGEGGTYKFANLAPGTYGVEIQPPSGYVLSAQAGTIDDLNAAHLSDVSAETGKITGIELSGSENQVNVDAVVNNRLTISGVVVNDADGDGLFDEGEGNFANIEVILTDENGKRIEGIEPIQTDANGVYSFTNIPAREGGYRVKFVAPNGTVFSPVQTGTDITEENKNDANDGLTPVITAEPGVDRPNVDAYINNLGSISGHFYLEQDTNGIVQAGDPKINTVRVSTMVNGQETFATVNEDGTFQFAGLPAGNYDLKFTVPAGYRISDKAGENLTDGLRNDVSAEGTVTGVPVTAGNTTENVDLVVHPVGAVAGTVFVEPDKDGNAKNQTGTLAGVEVKLLNAADDVVTDTITNAQGEYRFEDVIAGSGYKVRIVTPEGYNLSTLAGDSADISAENLNDFAPANKITAPFAVAGGKTVDNVDAVVHQFGGISGRIVVEENTDGRIADDETVIGASVTVRLLDAEGKAVTDVNGVAITTQTGADGTYSFAGLPAGEYQVAFDKPEALRFSPTTGGEDVTEADLNDFIVTEGSNTATKKVSVKVNETTGNVDAIMYGVGGVSGRMVALPNDSGTVTDNVTPTPLGDQTVTLRLEDGGELTATTNEDGTYVFENVPAGDHTVVFPEVNGYTFSEKKGTDENLQDPNLNDADPESREISVTVPRDGQVVNADAILHGATSISGIYFDDVDDDGTRDEGENTIKDVRVELLDAAGNVIASTETGENGAYKFEHLVGDKEYQVRFITPQGMAISPVPDEATESTNDAAAEEGRTNSSITEKVIPTADAPVTNLNGAATGTALLAGTVFNDENRDGVFDEGESGRAGVTVRLLDKNGVPVEGVEPVKTDADGNYSFRVELGEYRVEVVAPDNEALSTKSQDAGAVGDAGYSDVSAETGRTPVIAVKAGETVSTIDAGIVLIDGSISGTVIGERDTDGNATGDQPTTPVAGATVKLLDAEGNPVVDANNNPVQVTTDAEGNYTFNGVKPGNYIVDVDLPDGWAHSDQHAKTLDSRVNGDENKSVVSANAGTVAVTVATNENKTDVDAVAHFAQNIGGVFFEDTNGDGIRNGEEPVVPNIKVELLDAQGNVVESTTTGTDGAYEFTNVFPGTYSVRFTNPDAENKRITQVVEDAENTVTNDANADGVVAGIVVETGADNTGIDAGYTALLGSITGTVWNDPNDDEIIDEGETGIRGVTVELVDGEGNVVATTETGENGTYSFEGVHPGDYTVRVNKDDNPSFTNTDATTVESREVTVVSKETTTDHNFGYKPSKATLSGYIFDDVNRDGIRTGEGDGREAALSGVKVYLLNNAGERIKDADGNDIFTETNGDGYYEFKLEAGAYGVEIEVADGYTITDRAAEYAGMDAQDYSDIDPANRKSGTVVLTPGDNYTHLDAGITDIDAAISGTVYGERDDDGDVTDEDEASVPVPGATVELLDANGAVVDTVTTNASGAYAFGTQRPGRYSIRMALPAGWAFSEQAASQLESARQSYVGGVNEDMDARVQTGTIAQFELFTNADRVNIDAVAHSRANVSGTFFDDKNGDGLRGDDESARRDVSVALVDVDGNVVETTTTNRDGYYAFENVFPGEYTVRFDITDDENLVITPENPEQEIIGDTNNAVSGEDPRVGNTAPFSVEPGASIGGVDAASTVNQGSVAGTVWVDADRDRGIGNDEPERIGGVTVELVDGTGNVIAAVTTDEQGNYLFENVTPGDYTVRVAGENPQLDGREATTEVSTAVTVEPGSRAQDKNFGYVTPPVVPGAVSGTVWIDENEDGALADEDGRIAGVAVELEDAEGNVVTTVTTDASGNYRFENVAPGEYSVRVAENDNNERALGERSATTAKQITGVVVESDKDAADNNFGFVTVAEEDPVVPVDPVDPEPETGTVTGTVWMDTDRDQGINDDETGRIQSVAIELVDGEGAVVARTATDEFGNYTFSNVPAGEYTVKVVENNPALNPFEATTDAEREVTVTAGEEAGGNDFGYANKDVEPAPEPDPNPASITGTVWIDSDEDQNIGDDEGVRIGAVEVELLDFDDNVVATTLTDAFGNYTFNGLEPGDYQVRIADNENNQQALGEHTATTDTDVTVSVEEGEVGNANFGYVAPVPEEDDPIDPVEPPAVKGGVSGTVWRDEDRDGLIGVTEERLVDALVRLYDLDGNLKGETHTDEDGHYEFGEVEPGKYIVRVYGNDETGELESTTVGEYEIEVLPEEINTENNFGFAIKEEKESEDVPTPPEDGEYKNLGAVSGIVFNDVDRDGVIDSGEYGVGGVVVELLDENGTKIADVTTDQQGRYKFDNVPAGKYQIRVVNLDDYVQTYDVERGTTNPDNVVSVEVAEGETLESQNFGYVIEEEPTPGPVDGSSDLELKEILPWAAVALVPIVGGALADIGGRLPGMPAPSAPSAPARPAATTTPAPAQSGSGSTGSASSGTGSNHSARTTTTQNSSGSVARTLANTGASVIGLLILAGILMLVGIMLVVRGNRRQED